MLKFYRVNFFGRKRGAIGKFYEIVDICSVVCPTADEIIRSLGSRYEVNHLVWIKDSEGVLIQQAKLYEVRFVGKKRNTNDEIKEITITRRIMSSCIITEVVKEDYEVHDFLSARQCVAKIQGIY